MSNFKSFILAMIVLSLQDAKAQMSSNFKTEVEQYAQWLNLPTLAVGVAKGDSLIFFCSVGPGGMDANILITPDHIFSIASVTKSFTSVVMQQLEADGKISLTDPLDKFPNKYFTKDRWTKKTTLAHILSQTSESRPPGTNFIYNGSKYNIVFNAFAAINPTDTESMTRPFTKEIESRILVPLKMTHTLVRYNEAVHSTLNNYTVPSYQYDHTTQNFVALPFDLTKVECGPGFGMMSSMADLVKFSSALNNGTLISLQRYGKIIKPFYLHSPYGLGWFTCNFEGINLHWTYGYGSSDAALLLKVPLKNLTFILLSSCDLPSGSTRLGYGNPLNSPLVCSFIRNFILQQPNIIQPNRNIDSIDGKFRDRVKKSHSRIYIEEAFAKATVSLFCPTTNATQKAEGLNLLKLLINNFPRDSIWQSATAFELIASQDDVYVLRFASNISKTFTLSQQSLHPAILFYAGVVEEKLQNKTEAIKFFSKLSEGNAYNEQVYKFDALMKLAKYFQYSNPALSRHYLENLVRYKEYINSQDNQYKEAKALISKL